MEASPQWPPPPRAHPPLQWRPRAHLPLRRRPQQTPRLSPPAGRTAPISRRSARTGALRTRKPAPAFLDRLSPCLLTSELGLAGQKTRRLSTFQIRRVHGGVTGGTLRRLLALDKRNNEPGA